MDCVGFWEESLFAHNSTSLNVSKLLPFQHKLVSASLYSTLHVLLYTLKQQRQDLFHLLYDNLLNT